MKLDALLPLLRCSNYIDIFKKNYCTSGEHFDWMYSAKHMWLCPLFIYEKNINYSQFHIQAKLINILMPDNVFCVNEKKTSKRRVIGLFVAGIHRWPVNSPHNGPLTRKVFTTFDDVNTYCEYAQSRNIDCCKGWVGLTNSYRAILFVRMKNRSGFVKIWLSYIVKQ